MQSMMLFFFRLLFFFFSFNLALVDVNAASWSSLCRYCVELLLVDASTATRCM